MACYGTFVRWRPYLGYRAEQVKSFAETYYQRCGIGPTYTQVCEATGINTRGEVSRIVQGLERRELIRREGEGRTPRIKILKR